jgi:hypothetical protein
MLDKDEAETRALEKSFSIGEDGGARSHGEERPRPSSRSPSTRPADPFVSSGGVRGVHGLQGQPHHPALHAPDSLQVLQQGALSAVDASRGSTRCGFESVQYVRYLVDGCGGGPAGPPGQCA